MTRYFSTITILCILNTAALSQITLDSIADGPGYTYIASPNGTGPFPAVLYNHGGLGPNVGGDLRQTAISLANAGYMVRAEKRSETYPITGHLEQVDTALNLLRQDPRTDTDCVTIMGFSRGAYLTLEIAKTFPNKVKAIISMSPANPVSLLNTWAMDVSNINDPVLILTVTNDTLQDQHVILAQMVHDSLISSGKNSTFTIYPSYDSNGDLVIDGSDDGHALFFEVQPPYWSDVLNFLSTNSCGTTGLISFDPIPTTLHVYPNPFDVKTTVNFDNPNHESYSLKLYGLYGQLVKTIANITSGQATIDKGDLPKGLYLIRIGSDNGIKFTGKLTIR